jgi:hypothetical protein
MSPGAHGCASSHCKFANATIRHPSFSIRRATYARWHSPPSDKSWQLRPSVFNEGSSVSITSEVMDKRWDADAQMELELLVTDPPLKALFVRHVLEDPL